MNFSCFISGCLHLSLKTLLSCCQGAVGAAYVALIAALLLLMRANNQKRLTPSQVRAQQELLAAQKRGAEGDYGTFDEDSLYPAAPTTFEQDGAKYDDFFASSSEGEGDGPEPWWKAIQK